MENTTKKRLALVILNTIGLIVTIVFNALANALPLNGRMTGDISDSIPNFACRLSMVQPEIQGSRHCSGRTDRVLVLHIIRS